MASDYILKDFINIVTIAFNSSWTKYILNFLNRFLYQICRYLYRYQSFCGKCSVITFVEGLYAEAEFSRYIHLHADWWNCLCYHVVTIRAHVK